MHTFFALMATATLVVSCSAQQKELTYTDPEHYLIDTITRKYTVDYTARHTGGSDLITFNGKTWLMMNFCGAGKLMLRNIGKDSVIELQLNNPECTGVYTFMQQEGIHVILEDGRVLYYPSRSSLPQLQFRLNDIPAFKQSGMKPEWAKPLSGQKSNLPSDYVYFRVNQDYDNTNGTYSKYDIGYPICAKLNLKTKEVQFFGKMPRYVAHNDYGYLSEIFDMSIGDSIVFSKPINGEISVIDTKTGITTEYTIPSAYQVEPIKEFRFSRLKKPIYQRDKKMKHSTYSAYYEPLYYNPYDRHYYRIFHPKLTEYNAEGLLNTGFDKQNVLMVFDSNLKLLDEIVLPIKAERTPKLHPLQKGIEFIIPGAIEADTKQVEFTMLRIIPKG